MRYLRVILTVKLLLSSLLILSRRSDTVHSADAVQEALSPVLTVRVELIPYSQYTSTENETKMLYVDVDSIPVDQFGVPTCRVSSILPLAAPFESPLRSGSLVGSGADMY